MGVRGKARDGKGGIANCEQMNDVAKYCVDHSFDSGGMFM